MSLWCYAFNISSEYQSSVKAVKATNKVYKIYDESVQQQKDHRPKTA